MTGLARDRCRGDLLPGRRGGSPFFVPALAPITSVQTIIPTDLANVHNGFSCLVHVGDETHWYYRGGEDHPASSKGNIYRQITRDNGRSWAAEELVYSHATDDVCEVEAVIAPNGDLLLLGYLSSFPGGAPTAALMLRSDDAGATFTETTFAPSEFSGALASADWAVFYGKPKVANSTISADGYFKLFGAMWSCRYTSTDNGDTWALTGSSQSGYNECQSDGPDLTNMFRVLRANDASAGDLCYFQTTSNAGNTWTTPGLIGFGVGPRTCQLENGDWLLALGRRSAPGGTNLYRITAASGGRYLSRRVQAVTFSGTITDCGYGAMLQAQGENHLIFVGYQALATGTYPHAVFVKLIPLDLLEVGAWSETAFADLGAVDWNSAIASVTGGRLRINDNSGSLVLGALAVVNGGDTGNVSFTYEAAANTDWNTIQLRNAAGQAVFEFYHNPTGEWLQAYNGSAAVDPTTPVSIALDTLTTIEFIWNVTGAVCEVKVNGVSKGTVPKWSGRSGVITSIMFAGGSAGGIAADYRVGNLGQS